jgi:hypothetical protein
MKKLFEKLRHNLVIRVVLIYVAIAWIVIQAVEQITPLLGLPDAVARGTVDLAVLNLFPALFVPWIIEPASLPDRRLMFLRIAWTMAPAAIVLNACILVRFGFMGGLKGLLVWGLLFLVPIIWAQMSAPFARAWAFRQAHDPTALIRAEQRLQWPLKSTELKEVEIHLAPSLYYTFVAGIAAIIFIVSETVIAETFDDTLGSVGYVGASVIALGIATVVYPVHKRVSKYIAPGNDRHVVLGASDAKSVGREIVHALLNYFKLHFIRYWYVIIPLGVILLLLGYLAGHFTSVIR